MIKFRRLPNAKDLPLPSYESEGAAGMDLRAAIEETIILWVDETKIIPTGFAMEIPKGFEAQIRPRSSMGAKGIIIPNAPGTIDCDFRGEVLVILHNLGPEPFKISPGARIAQMVIAPVCRMQVSEVSALTETVRGVGGFGSTGAL